MKDSAQTLEFGWQSRGAFWDPTTHLFTVNLKSLGVRLSGDVRVNMRARATRFSPHVQPVH